VGATRMTLKQWGDGAITIKTFKDKDATIQISRLNYPAEFMPNWTLLHDYNLMVFFNHEKFGDYYQEFYADGITAKFVREKVEWSRQEFKKATIEKEKRDKI